MATAVKHQPFVEYLAEKIFDLGADTLKFLLTNAAPTATHGLKSDLTEISSGNGYTAGGHTSAQVTSAQASGTYKLVLTDVVITASGGSIGPLRGVELYDDTAASDQLILGWDYGSSITLLTGETLTIDCDATNGVLQIA